MTKATKLPPFFLLNERHGYLMTGDVSTHCMSVRIGRNAKGVPS